MAVGAETKTSYKVKVHDVRLQRSDLPKIYRKAAPFYDLWGQMTQTKARKRCVELADVKDGESVLEIAAGAGLAFVEILRLKPSGQNEDLVRHNKSRAGPSRKPRGLEPRIILLEPAMPTIMSVLTTASTW